MKRIFRIKLYRNTVKLGGVLQTLCKACKVCKAFGVFLAFSQRSESFTKNLTSFTGTVKNPSYISFTHTLMCVKL